MDLPLLTATRFVQSLSNGRTQPLLFGCEDQDGTEYEVVVKLRGRELDARAQIAELVSAKLAHDLGLNVPQAAVVEVPVGFEAVVSQSNVADAIRESHGPNFGSRHLGTSFTTWPPHRAPYGNQRDQAAAIFAFDALVQNPDRRAVNPNLWVQAEQIGVYDHEQAFAFLYLPIIGGPARPWIPADQASNAFQFMTGHIFYPALRGATFDLEPFGEKLGGLSDGQIDTYTATVPDSWRGGHDLCAQITQYLQEARAGHQVLVNYVNHLLR